MIVQAAAYEKFLSFDSVKEMGWWNVLWVILIAFIVLAAKAKKIGVTSIGKNEWGVLEILGFPLIPIPFGLWPFVKGVLHVKQVSTAPVRIDFASRREVDGRVLMVNISVFIRVTRRYVGAWWKRFIQLRRDLISALYGTLDENVDDAENPERIEQTRAVLESATRTLLKGAKTVDEVSLEKLHATCGSDLKLRFGEYIDSVYIREDAPVDGQLWKEGRAPFTEDDVATENGELPPVRVIGSAPSSTA